MKSRRTRLRQNNEKFYWKINLCFSTDSGYFNWKRLEKKDFFTLLVTGVDSETRGDGTVGVEDLDTSGDGDRVEDDLNGETSGDTNVGGDGDNVVDDLNDETSGDTNGDGAEMEKVTSVTSVASVKNSQLV